jgi:hypothetical protein
MPLSPIERRRLIPSDPAANLRLRRKLLLAARADPNVRRGLVEACRQDVVFFVAVAGWQYNPKRPGNEVGPFIPWPAQVECLDWLVEGHVAQRDGVIEKSREEGATWLVLFVEAWLGLFHKAKKCANLSRNADAVDKSGDTDTLFWKLDYILEHVPDWMKPGGEPRRIKNLIEFHGTRSQLSGQATTKAALVGGRASFALIDELGQIEADHEIVSDTADSSDARQFVSTHTGQGTAFHNLCLRADEGHVRRFRLHWSMNPRKNAGLYRAGPHGEFEPIDKSYVFPPDFAPVLDGSPTGGPFPGLRSPWYDAEVVRRGGQNHRNVKLNLDVDVAGATKQFYEPLLIRTLVKDCRDPEWEGDLHYDASAATPVELVPRPGGPLKLWFSPGAGAGGRLNHVPRYDYVVGCDPSAGTGATASCLTVFNATRGEKWAEYTNALVKPESFGKYAVAVCRLFLDADEGPAFLVWETPGPGIVMGQTIYHEIGYRNVYLRTDEFAGEQRESDTPGWNSTAQAGRLYIHSEYQSALRSRAFVNYSAGSLEETLAFVHEAGSVMNPKAKKTEDASGAGANHSDHVVADALAWFGAKKRGLVGERLEEKKAEHVAPNSVAGRALARAMNNRLTRSIWARS